jgi:hypothetical protein
MSPHTSTRRAFLQGGAAAVATLAMPHVARAATITLHLCGDSIARGFGLGTFASKVPPSHPLYVFRAIWSMGNVVLEENNIAARIAHVPIGLQDGSPPWELLERVSRRTIRSGDWVFFEDAGPHGSEPDEYESNWNGMLQSAAGPGIHRALLTMFDYPPAPLEARYDVSFKGRTMNDVNRAAAQANGAVLVDSNKSMDAWVAFARQTDGASVMHPDGVHPNVWGQLRMLKDLLITAGLRSSLRTVASLQSPAAANYRLLAYGAPAWTPQRARAYCASLLQP